MVPGICLVCDIYFCILMRHLRVFVYVCGCLCAAINLREKIAGMYVYSYLHCLWSCVQMCVFVRKKLVFVLYFLRQAVALETGLQGQPLPSQTQSLSDSES